jgi:macrophage erythroblast attacher
MRERLHHLAAVEALQNGNGPEFTRWADTRLDRWLVDWALRNGKEKTARKIAENKDIEVSVCFSLCHRR